ncbi:MAG: hypothetical protein N2322_08030, partial [Terrimicrobiaceae bacterium]|nr:hypothetical protein [Terrimicrobiaceae bacterium]
PETNAGCSIVALDRSDKPARIQVPPQARHARSLAFLHATTNRLPKGTPVAIVRLFYTNGASHPVFVRSGHEIGHWWDARPEMIEPPRHYDVPVFCAPGWNGPNGSWKNTGVFAFSMDNPFPDQELAVIEVDPSPLLAMPSGGLLLCAVSASSQPAGLGLRTRSGGLPLCWALSSVFHGLMNGLAGIEDRASAFRRVRIAPRFACTPARRVRACLHYPASDAYCLYEYVWEPGRNLLTLDIAGSFASADIHLLLPRGRQAASAKLGGAPLPFTISTVDSSSYLDIALAAPPAFPIEIELPPA